MNQNRSFKKSFKKRSSFSKICRRDYKACGYDCIAHITGNNINDRRWMKQITKAMVGVIKNDSELKNHFSILYDGIENYESIKNNLEFPEGGSLLVDEINVLAKMFSLNIIVLFDTKPLLKAMFSSNPDIHYILLSHSQYFNLELIEGSTYDEEEPLIIDGIAQMKLVKSFSFNGIIDLTESDY